MRGQGAEVKDLYWVKPDGAEMSDHDWSGGHVRCLGMALPGDQIDETGERGERMVGDSFVILFNAHHESISFRLGARKRDVRWICVFDTAASCDEQRSFKHMDLFPLQARSLVVLRGELLPGA